MRIFCAVLDVEVLKEWGFSGHGSAEEKGIFCPILDTEMLREQKFSVLWECAV